MGFQKIIFMNTKLLYDYASLCLKFKFGYMVYHNEVIIFVVNLSLDIGFKSSAILANSCNIAAFRTTTIQGAN